MSSGPSNLPGSSWPNTALWAIRSERSYYSRYGVQGAVKAFQRAGKWNEEKRQATGGLDRGVREGDARTVSPRPPLNAGK